MDGEGREDGRFEDADVAGIKGAALLLADIAVYVDQWRGAQWRLVYRSHGVDWTEARVWAIGRGGRKGCLYNDMPRSGVDVRIM